MRHRTDMENKYLNTISNLKDLRNYLDDFSRHLEFEMDDLRDRLEHVDETDGSFQEMLERYKMDYFNVLSKDMCQIVEQIRNQHLEFLDRFIERYGRVWHKDENGKLEEKSIN